MNEERQTIIIVDDDLTSLNIGKSILKTSYQVIPAQSAAQLFEVLEKVIPDLILLDVAMPEISGYDAIKKLKTDQRFAEIPVIFVTSLDEFRSELQGLNLGAADYIAKPFSVQILQKRIANQLLIVQQKKELLHDKEALRNYAENLEEMVKARTAEVLHLQTAVLTTVADLVEFRDELTGGHTERTGRYLKLLTEEMLREGVYKEEVSGWNIDFFLQSAQLHDVGKIAIPDGILNKPGKLTLEEFEIIKRHVSVGVEAVKRIMATAEEHAFLRHALHITGAHHEKWDGTGYCGGLGGKDIPLEGRLMAVADVYDALVTVRPYKEAFSHEVACRIIEEGAGTHFDPVLVEVFRSVEEKFKLVAK